MESPGLKITSPRNKLTQVKLRASPSNLSRSKNLTGNARLLRDLAADIHANIQDWNKYYLTGVSILQSITTEITDSHFSQSIQELCDKLESICDSLDKVVENLGQIAHQMKLVSTLQQNSSDVLFSTWPVSLFGIKAAFIHEAYHKEAQIKRKILEEVARDCTESWKMLHLAGWVHQPYIGDDITTMLESLLIETGHR